jgi:aminopeptidase YwaD
VLRHAVSLAFVLAAASCAAPEVDDATSVANLEADPKDPLAHLGVIASAEMDGRGTPSPGLDRAIAYVVGQVTRAGLDPVLDGGRFEQPFTVAGGRTSNIVGRHTGRGPRASELVVFSAHLDHLGHGFPGADDDGSGSAALLAIAHRLAGTLTDRSVLFLWTTGEEKGLLGSSYFVEHSPVPLTSIVQVLNLDAIGALDDARFSVLPDGTTQSTSTVSMLESASLAMDPPFTRMNLDLAAYTRRTDAWSFVKKGVPAIWVSEGLTNPTGGGSLMPRYHRSTDTFENLLADNGGRKLRRMVDILERTAVELAR